jgi:uncharacterized protein involved in type VI secretion and phage assembly
MPAAAAKHVSPYEIRIDGTALDPKYKDRLLEVKVRQSLRQPSSATIRISDPKAENMDSHPLQIGKKLQILLGGPEAQTPTKVFDGEIVALDPEFEKDGASIGVRAYDKSHRLNRAKKVRTFQQMSASNMVTKVLNEAGLSPRVTATSTVFEFFQQSDETDREFIRRLERMHDYELVTDGDTAEFRPAGKLGSAAVTLKYGDGNLISFRPRVTAAQQDQSVEVRSWDPKAKSNVVGSLSSVPDPAAIGLKQSKVKNDITPGKLLISDRVAANSGEANQLAKAALQRRAASYLEAEGTCIGNPLVKAGATIALQGLGQKLSGNYVVTSVTHVLRSPATFKTHFQISGRSDRGLLDLMHPPEPRPWGQSLVIGVVTNNNDPEQQGRVRVKYPSLSDNEESAWARIATPSAGNQRGLFMIPQPDEEVIVAFENGDPRRPFVLGSLFNGKDKPGDDLLLNGRKGGFAVVSNDKALLHTKQDMNFKSDTNMIIEVKSNEEHKVNGNLKAQADAQVEMKAGSTYTLQAGTSMTIKGVSITVEASGTLSLKGATVEIQGQAATNIKGAIINIG